MQFTISPAVTNVLYLTDTRGKLSREIEICDYMRKRPQPIHIRPSHKAVKSSPFLSFDESTSPFKEVLPLSSLCRPQFHPRKILYPVKVATVDRGATPPQYFVRYSRIQVNPSARSKKPTTKRVNSTRKLLRVVPTAPRSSHSPVLSVQFLSPRTTKPSSPLSLHESRVMSMSHFSFKSFDSMLDLSKPLELMERLERTETLGLTKARCCSPNNGYTSLRRSGRRQRNRMAQ